jgi:hypothetical protein
LTLNHSAGAVNKMLFNFKHLFCTWDQAVTLRELHVKQDSLFYYVDENKIIAREEVTFHGVSAFIHTELLALRDFVFYYVRGKDSLELHQYENSLLSNTNNFIDKNIRIPTKIIIKALMDKIIPVELVNKFIKNCGDPDKYWGIK